MPDDEPLDDARAVGMAAAAATAKVMETAARAAADQRSRQQRLPARNQPTDRAATDPEAAAAKQASRLQQAEAWAQKSNPKAFDTYTTDRMGADTPDGRRSAERALIGTWESATQQPYDSAERRAGADNAMKAAGVADEPRKARTVSDLLNGTDPLTAAAAGKTATAAPARAKQRTSEQARTR